MDRPSNMPRRAYQRRNLRRNKTADSNSSTSESREQFAQHASAALPQNRQPRSPQERGDETDSSVCSMSDSEPEEYGQSRRLPAAPRASLAARPRRQRSSADGDSGYCSPDDDADERAEYYDDLLERFRADGPTLANHGKNTKKMETEQEEIWNK